MTCLTCNKQLLHGASDKFFCSKECVNKEIRRQEEWLKTRKTYG